MFETPTKKLHCKTLPLMTCNERVLSTLPYFKTRDLINASFNTEIHDHPYAATPYLKKLNENKNNTSIAHLNVDPLMSTFNTFSPMLDEYQFDVITLSETWLKDYIFINKTISRLRVIMRFLKIESVKKVLE